MLNLHIKLFSTLWLLAVTLSACSSEQRNGGFDTERKPQTQGASNDARRLQPKLGKKQLTANGNYYLLTLSSDSTVRLSWGNETVQRIYDSPLDFMLAERLQVKWENQDYLILDYFTGSNAWFTIVLPLNSNEPFLRLNNGLCFDLRNNLLVTEQWGGDTVLAAYNLKSRQTQFIVEKEQLCDAVTCIDTVSIENRLLYYKWTTQNGTEYRRSVEKRVRLTI